MCLFSFISLFLHPAALLSSVLDLLSDRLFAHVGKGGQRQFQACFVCVTVSPVEREIISLNKSNESPRDESHWPLWNDTSIQKPTTMARRMEYMDWPGSPMEARSPP